MAITSKIIVLLSMPRSGSHFLRAAIANGSDIVNLDEPFNPDLGDRTYRFDRFLRAHILSDLSWRMDARNADTIIARYFERLVEEGKGRPILIDIKDDELRILEWPPTVASAAPRVLRHILNARYPIIRLERRDRLAQYASVERAKLTGEWVRTDHRDPSEATLTLDYAHARNWMLQVSETACKIRDWINECADVLSLTYEDMIENDRLTASSHDALSAFLGRRLSAPRAAMPVKLAPPLETLVANLQEIRFRLAAERLDWLCDPHRDGKSVVAPHAGKK